MLREGELNEKDIELQILDNSSSSMPTIDIPGMPGAQMGMINLGDLLGKGMGGNYKTKKMKVKDSYNFV